MKAYCQDCKYFEERRSVGFLRDLCKAPENIVDTYVGPNLGYKNWPDDINKNNDCPWIKTSGPGQVKDINWDASGKVISYTKYEL